MPFVLPAIAAAWAAVTAAVAAISITSIVVSAAISIGLSLLSSLLLQSSQRIQEQKENIRQALAPRSKYYGRVKTGGIYAFLQVANHSSGNGTLYQVILLMTGMIDGFEEHYLGDDLLTLDDDGNVTVPKRYINNDGTRLANIQTKLGTQTQSAYSDLESAFPGSWTSDFQLKGIASALIKLISPEPKNFSIAFPSGLVPYNAVYRAAKVFDPRDPSQTLNSLASHKWTRNGVLMVLDYMISSDGMRLPYSLFAGAIDVWSLMANVADDVVALADGGSEPLFALSGGYQFTDAPKTVLPKMLDPMDARVGLRADGSIVIDVGQWQEPTLIITDADIYAYELARGRDKGDIKNDIRAQFVSPDYQFVEQEAQRWQNEASISTDGLQTAMLDLSWATSHRMSRKRQKIEAIRQDPDRWIGQIITKAVGLNWLLPRPDGTKQRTVRFQIAELGLDSTFEPSRFAFDVKSGRCTFSVGEMLEQAYSWSLSDEGNAPALPNAVAPDGVEDPSSLAVTVQGSELQAIVPAPDQTGLKLRIEYAPHDDGTADDEKNWSDFSVSDWSGTTVALGANTYDVRTYFVNAQGLISDYLYERGFIVGGKAPSTPKKFSISASGGDVTILFATPNTKLFSAARVWRSATNNFNAAIDISDAIFGAANQAMSWDDTPGTGTWWYFATAEDAALPPNISAPTTGASVTI